MSQVRPVRLAKVRLIDAANKLLNEATESELRLCVLLIRTVVGRAWREQPK